MGIWSKFKEKTSRWIDRGKDFLLQAAECTLEVCSTVARAAATVTEYVATKVEEFERKVTDWNIDRNVPNEVKETHKPIIQNSVREIKNHFPKGMKESINLLNPEERKEKVKDLAITAAPLLGIKNPPEVKFFIPKNEDEFTKDFGSYNFRENILSLNLPLVTCGEPKLLQEQVSTVFHEMVHARQRAAVNALIHGRSVQEFGYTEEYVLKLAYNFAHYIRPEEDYEAYTKQPIEAEAYYFEHRLKELLAKIYN